jgi:hypothetical protein
MTQEAINFTMTAAPRRGGEQSFRSHVDQIVANGAGAAVFSLVDIDNGSATLHGVMVHDRRTITSEALEEYLEDVLASREGIELNLSVTISAQGSRPPAANGGATTGLLSEAQEEQSPDVAVVNATRERVAASAGGNDTVPGPDTRNESPPAPEGGHFLG